MSAIAPSDGICLECGDGLAAPQPEQEFCSKRCRQAFNNRRMQRGAQVFDLYMAIRYERDAAREEKVVAQLSRLCMHFREEDDRQRGGRRSWGNWRKFLENNPYLRVVRLGRIVCGRGPSSLTTR